jgi:hypothetical protein
MAKKWIQRAGVLLGILIAGSMLFANQLGIDNNSAWGTKRSIIFLLGIFFLTFALLYRENNFIGKLFHTQTGQLYLSSAILSGIILLAYLWWASLGLWTSLPPTTNYYDLLATAFSHGSLSLEVQPDPALLALENPYEPANREGIPVLWDASYFRGKYYLYWGPVPSLMLLPIKVFTDMDFGDNLLALFFIAGIFFFQVLIIFYLYHNYFEELSYIVILGSIALAGLMNPAFFVLVNARIYEAAVAAGQFFFIGGLYFLFKAFNQSSKINFAFAGLFFALAVGSRTILLIPIGFLSIIVLIHTFKTQRAFLAPTLIAFATPLVFGVIAYIWYNFARFGSFSEFGFTYQLTGFNIKAGIKDTFSLSYIPPNLYKTLFNPFEINNRFPFIRPTIWSPPTGWFVNYGSKIYYLLAEAITGIFVGTPFVLFAFVPKKKIIFWNSISLTGSTLLILFTIQIFFFTAMRYLLDLMPALTLLALVGFWSGLDLLKNSRIGKAVYTFFGASLWAYTIGMSVMLAFASNVKRFKEFNPEGFLQIANLFNGLFK